MMNMGLRPATAAPRLTGKQSIATESMRNVRRVNVVITRSSMNYSLSSERKNGAPGGIRTHDQLIKSQLLYQLSYRGDQCA